MAIDLPICGREMVKGVKGTFSETLVPQVVGAGCEEAGEVCIRDTSRGSLPVDERGGVYLLSKASRTVRLLLAVRRKGREAFELFQEARLFGMRGAATGFTRRGL